MMAKQGKPEYLKGNKPWWFWPVAGWLPCVMAIRLAGEIGLVDQWEGYRGFGSMVIPTGITLVMLVGAWRDHRKWKDVDDD